MRKQFRSGMLFLFIFYTITSFFWPPALWSLLLVGPLALIGIRDYFQTKHSVLRNYPMIGHLRFLLEKIRPEMHQYFVESNTEGAPFSRDLRSVVYQRAKKEMDTVPFGTQKNVNQVGYMWINHSITPSYVDPQSLRVTVGGPDCQQPYSASVLNISAMSYGALSKNAILALNQGAQIGGFYHNTGEGSASPYHLENGGDLVYQIGTGYFGCRAPDGRFSVEKFKKIAATPQIKMIELKLSQGAKPGHGGILPAKKLTEEIAEIRGVPMGHDVHSPAGHTAFSTPIELVQFIKQLRTLSKGKPIGIKLCLGERREFIALCKAMLQENIFPDFITVDGGEGGTGAAPLEFSNSVGSPLTEALIFIHNSLVGFNIRNRLKLIVSGKIITSFDLIHKFALGADICNSARGMMMALGCIQALRCNSNDCPVGVATQNPELYIGLNVTNKSQRVAQFHSETLRYVSELMAAMGVQSIAEIKPSMIMRRTGLHDVKTLDQIVHFLKNGELLKNPPAPWDYYLKTSSPETFKEITEITETQKAA